MENNCGGPLHGVLCSETVVRNIDKEKRRDRTDLIAPGATVTSATATVCAIGNTVESANLIVPPDRGVGVT